MNEEIDESEFSFRNFTTASEWEVFIARVEEVIHEWKEEVRKETASSPLEQSSTNWKIREEKLFFVDVAFTLTYYKNLLSLTHTLNDDESTKTVHPLENTKDFHLRTATDDILPLSLAHWYGLEELIVLSPVHNGIISESQIKVLLSSLHMAISNVESTIPMFVQIREKWQNCYLGVYEGAGIRTDFEMIHLKKGPQHCQYLTGLLDLFKTKILSPIVLDPINVSVRFTYQLCDSINLSAKHDSNELTNALSCSFQFGATSYPFKAITLRTTWLNLSDHMIVDSENYSDFDPAQAPLWSLQVSLDNTTLCHLSNCLSEFARLIGNEATLRDILGDLVNATEMEHNPFNVLTEPPVPTISTVLKQATRNSANKTNKKTPTYPIPECLLVPILYFLFPDAEEEPLYPYADKNKEKENDNTPSNSALEALGRGFKTCGADSLVWRLSIVLAQMLNLKDLKTMAYIWLEFFKDIRYRWENSILIPGVEFGFPDPRTSLLHQKLQMLNCCIERKRAREMPQSQSSAANTGESLTDDEEFFDCTADMEEEEQVKKCQPQMLWNQPVGRLGRFGNVKLIKTGDPLYIPNTQEPVPKTEDQLEEDAHILLKLGSDAQGSELRAKMMSASLLSDMASFKAANPGSVLEDFIRWYSPRDWIEEDGDDEWGQKRGHLSSRMLISDNMWVQVWESAKPVPANRQKRLFDDTREAEKILHFLESRTMSQICEMLVAILAHAALNLLGQHCEQVVAELPEATPKIRHIAKIIEKLSRAEQFSSGWYSVLVEEVRTLELSIAQVKCISSKLNPNGDCDGVGDLVAKLIIGNEVEIEGGGSSPVGANITQLFCEAQRVANLILGESPTGGAMFPQASEREFVMRVNAVRPSTYSAKCPQMLRAILNKNEFRLAGAFSEDIVFF